MPSENEGKKESLEDKLTKKPEAPSIPKDVLETIAKNAKNELMVELLKDPAFAQVAQAKANQKNVRVVPEDEFLSLQNQRQAPIEKESDLADLDLTDPKQLAGFLEKSVGSIVEKRLKETVTPLNQKLKQVEDVIGQEQQNRYQQSIEGVRKDFPDFDDYMDKMVQLNRQNPALSPKQLYVLAKTDAGKPITTERRTDTERPSSVSTRPPLKVENVAPGRKGIQDLVAAAVKNQDLSELMNTLPPAREV